MGRPGRTISRRLDSMYGDWISRGSGARIATPIYLIEMSRVVVPKRSTKLGVAVQEILGRAKVDRISLVAHSWGTLPAGAFAAAHPEVVDRLVLFGPIARRDGSTSRPSLPPFRSITVEAQYERFMADVPAHEEAVMSKTDFEVWAAAYLASDQIGQALDPPAVIVPSGPAADIQDAWRGMFPYDPSLVICPTLIVRGEWDSLTNDHDAAWLFNALTCTRSTRDVKISKATHLMHLEKSRHELHAVTRDFLRGEGWCNAAEGPIASLRDHMP
jgi:pimeloyl-ACP methyl ester carboxylesterase